MFAVLNAVVMCPSLDDPVNGQVTVSRFTVGDNALYSCNTGFFVNGSLLRTCGSDGEWSDEAPTCPRKLKKHKYHIIIII